MLALRDLPGAAALPFPDTDGERGLREACGQLSKTPRYNGWILPWKEKVVYIQLLIAIVFIIKCNYIH